jgi:hypothetical protein
MDSFIVVDIMAGNSIYEYAWIDQSERYFCSGKIVLGFSDLSCTCGGIDYLRGSGKKASGEKGLV